MVGRNEPCPCGSGKKYKKCCERVVALDSVEKARAERESRLKHDLLVDLQHWFTGRISPEMQKEWAQRFKKLMQLPLDQPISQEYATYFRFWLLFDAPCLNRRRPVEVWRSTIRNAPHKERMARNMSESTFTCYEISQTDEHTLTLTSLTTKEQVQIQKGESIPREKLVFTRLLRVGQRYEFFGPYTSFAHEMRGEILVQLEKYNHPEEERQEYTTWENGWKVFGWSIKRTEEVEQGMLSAPVVTEPMVEETAFWPVVEPKEEELPLRVMQHLEQFYFNHVATLQKGTQTLYSRSLELLYKYLSMRFGQSFDWSMLDEEVLCHFLSVWYLDQGKVTAPGSKIFLNTLKHLFRWLKEEGISDAYLSFRKVYASLIRALPVAVEAKKWMEENGVKPDYRNNEQTGSTQMVMLAFSSTGPALLIEDKWLPVNLLGVPTMWSEHRFWVHGTVQMEPSGCYFTRIDGLYPIISLDNQLKVLGHK
ncbi:SEC-C motif-containing protein [Laceyella sediminis]|uniref:SEC-C motif-containing protein n=3 Tax=Laceyella TaxID=292635 RepID=A0ABX5EVI2_9BACL|nr:SEC-C motif-containing protein [Laceyella sediminis]